MTLLQMIQVASRGKTLLLVEHYATIHTCIFREADFAVVSLAEYRAGESKLAVANRLSASQFTSRKFSVKICPVMRKCAAWRGNTILIAHNKQDFS